MAAPDFLCNAMPCRFIDRILATRYSVKMLLTKTHINARVSQCKHANSNPEELNPYSRKHSFNYKCEISCLHRLTDPISLAGLLTKPVAPSNSSFFLLTNQRITKSYSQLSLISHSHPSTCHLHGTNFSDSLPIDAISFVSCCCCCYI